MPIVQFRVLGRVEVHTSDDRVLSLPRRQARCLLGVLLLNPDRVVPTERVCNLLWEHEAPNQARQVLRSLVSRIRAMLMEADGEAHSVRLVYEQDGYRLTASPELIDAHTFRNLINTAAGAPELEVRDNLLRKALAMWRGPALHNAADDRLRQWLCADLDDLHLYAIEESAAVGLELGRHRELIPELGRLVGEHPLRESLIGTYMLALCQAGRASDALDTYHRTRNRLAEQLGLDPSPSLRHIHEAILRGDVEPAAVPASLTRPTPTPGTPVAKRSATSTVQPRVATAPRQLPFNLATFVGRAPHLQQLDALVQSIPDQPTAVSISAISGPAGIGKTCLALRWAHHIANRFPDGQLYVNLRGYDAEETMLNSAEAIRGFLDALAIPPERLPTSLDAQIGLYRSLVADKRLLILLDNARDADQIRPLLPGTSAPFVLVTSRNQLTSLVAAEGAHLISLDLLSTDEAHDLLVRRLGHDRVITEPQAVGEIIAACAGLPLALAVVAARAVTRPTFPLTLLADELRDVRDSLTPLSGEDTRTNIRTVFSWSYRLLSPPAARLFRLLGLHPGPDISVPAAAGLAGRPSSQVRVLLAELAHSHMLAETLPDHYILHGLLRVYANELTRATDSQRERRTAARRLREAHFPGRGTEPFVDSSVR